MKIKDPELQKKFDIANKLFKEKKYKDSVFSKKSEYYFDLLHIDHHQKLVCQLSLNEL